MTFSPFAALGLAVAALATPTVLAAQTAAPTAPASAFTIDMPIEALMADERAKAVLVKHLPDIDQHPSYEDFKALSLKTLAPFSQGLINDAVLAKISADLAAIK